MATLETRVYVNDVGTVFEVDAIEDIHDATVLKIMVKKPSGVTTEWTATLKAGTVSVLTYTTILGDLDIKGVYQIQSSVQTPAGSWRGQTTSFPVLDSFE